jgi:hypothetical protein
MLVLILVNCIDSSCLDLPQVDLRGLILRLIIARRKSRTVDLFHLQGCDSERKILARKTWLTFLIFHLLRARSSRKPAFPVHLAFTCDKRRSTKIKQVLNMFAFWYEQRHNLAYFWSQMGAIVFIILQIFFATGGIFWKLGNITRIFPSFNWAYSVTWRVYTNRVKIFDGL